MNNRNWGWWFDLRNLFLLAGLVIAISVRAGENEDRWWPVQTLPAAVVRTANQQELPASRVAIEMMVQSVAGLAAKAANEARSEELV